MKRWILVFLLLPFISGHLFSQDSLYTRKGIAFLTSKKCFGRGYVKNGLTCAEEFLLKQITSNSLLPVFSGGYSQAFTHPVVTFPDRCKVKINNVALKPGNDFIPQADSRSLLGKFKMTRKDSVSYVNEDAKLVVLKKEKLTFTVAHSLSDYTVIEVISSAWKNEPETVEIELDSRLITDFESNNCGGMIRGTSASDSMIVFTAHYDHLGGIGRKTFFPGANDNASGVSFLLNLIRYYRKNQPKYNTVFVFFAGEEAGLLGSKFFVANNPIALNKIKFLVNLDLLGTGDDGIMVVNGAVHEEKFNLLNELNNEKHLVKEIRKRGKAANSDHYWFSEHGVPCFFIYTLGGTKAYHDVYDTEKNLPLTDYHDVFELLVSFIQKI